MEKTTTNTTETSKPVSIFRLVFIQSIVTLVGFVLLFGLCTKQFLRYQFSSVTDLQLQELSEHQRVLSLQQQPYDETSFLSVIDRVCIPMKCSIEDLTSEIVEVPPFQKQSLRLVASIELYNIPILLDVFRAHPYRFSLEGVEVHAMAETVKVQIRLSRTLFPQDISEPDWVANLGWTEAELIRITALYGSWLTSRWAEKSTAEYRSALVDWTTLYGTLHRDLWRVYRQKGALVYTPETGIVLRYDE